MSHMKRTVRTVRDLPWYRAIRLVRDAKLAGYTYCDVQPNGRSRVHNRRDVELFDVQLVLEK